MEKFNSIRDVARELARKYSTMTHDELDILESVLVPHKYLKGQMILSEGEVCKEILYIAKGMTRQFYYKNGKGTCTSKHISNRNKFRKYRFRFNSK